MEEDAKEFALCISITLLLKHSLFYLNHLEEMWMFLVAGLEVVICNLKLFAPSASNDLSFIHYLHLCHVDRLVDEYPSGGLIARRDGDGALVSDVTCGVRVKVGDVQAHQ